MKFRMSGKVVDGVALAAIQALYEKVQELRKRLATIEGLRD